eukprot:COSAG02_NODE_19677_length_870_cov_0.894942_1_plen_126_part_10
MNVRCDEEFKGLVESGSTAIVKFYASWCEPCKIIAPTFAELARASPSVTFAEVDIDSCKVSAAECDVKAMPTFVSFVGGQKVSALSGANESTLKNFIRNHTKGGENTKAGAKPDRRSAEGEDSEGL